MGKYRYSVNKDIMDSSEYTNKRSCVETMKYAESKNINKKDKNFKIDYNTLQFTNFNDYSTYISMIKTFQTYNKKYYNYSNNVATIKDGINSYICNDDVVMYAKNCKYGCLNE